MIKPVYSKPLNVPEEREGFTILYVGSGVFSFLCNECSEIVDESELDSHECNS